MARNTVQFQKGMSLPEFLKNYASEDACWEALFKLRWPGGFRCPECEHHSHCRLKSRKLIQCHRCHHQTSLTANTVFSHTKLPLTTWFLAIFLLTQSKSGLSAMALSRHLGVSYAETTGSGRATCIAPFFSDTLNAWPGRCESSSKALSTMYWREAMHVSAFFWATVTGIYSSVIWGGFPSVLIGRSGRGV